MLKSAKSIKKHQKFLREHIKSAKLNAMISQAYIYELLLKPHGITLEEAEKPVKPLTPKEVQKGLITGKIPKKLFIRLYQRIRKR
ncbi:hypothetical protein [Megamonas sp.]|uniref:hypothetical protein n=1 Tax=Megamonas sp. TaxID=2049033 RepID=UPI0025807942|nr:hypothetical protein [Megamonas sp.]MBS5780089.1 hypothetical protein [Megamonas sp.]